MAEFLNKEEQRALINLARFTLEKWARYGESPTKEEIKRFNISENLETPSGVFVSLHKGENLRGCIGWIAPIKKLIEGVISNTISASSNDPRFSPVRESELKDISIEISVLTPMVEFSSLDEIEIGRDGLYIEKGGRRGLLLPQVAVEWGWNKKEFLEETCLKAGLSRNAWQKDACLFKFSAQVFH